MGQQEDVEVDQGTEAVRFDICQIVMLEVQYLEVVLLGQDSAFQFGQGIVAEVKSYQLVEAGEDGVGEEVTGDVVVGDVQEKKVLQSIKYFTW